jgi:hypothetical protein
MVDTTTVPTWLAVTAVVATPASAGASAVAIFGLTSRRDHRRWLREERKAAYTSFLYEANAVYLDRFAAQQVRIESGGAPASTAADMLMPEPLAKAVDAVELLGPTKVNSKLQAFLEASALAKLDLAATSADLEAYDRARETAQETLVSRMRKAMKSRR